MLVRYFVIAGILTRYSERFILQSSIESINKWNEEAVVDTVKAIFGRGFDYAGKFHPFREVNRFIKSNLPLGCQVLFVCHQHYVACAFCRCILFIALN